MWYLMLHSGIHATIAGVLLAFAIPFGNGGEKSTSYILQKALHIPVAFIVIPLFALANTAVRIPADWTHAIIELNSIGILTGLVIGKPVGIFIFSFVSTKIKLTQLPEQISWNQIIGAGMLGGIGFTMSIFITLLAFNDEQIIDLSKLVILFSSVLSGVIRYYFLRMKYYKCRIFQYKEVMYATHRHQ